ncbi:MAG: alpha-E domain-containing protein [Candidatus Competibacteraceae bacterium]|nr:alpha-E domain-containing protein [Candidatus Competibacteraceae bacterium]
MLSRVAENVYWMARYVERVENIARLLDVNNHLQLDTAPGEDGQWMPLISIMADEERFFKRHRVATQDTVTHFMACDPENPNSIVSCLRAARENARSIREIISSDMWLQLNTMYLMMSEKAPAAPKKSRRKSWAACASAAICSSA